jgi:hypothetical protein
VILKIDYNNNGVFPHHQQKNRTKCTKGKRKRENIPTSDSRAVEKWWDERMRKVRKTKMVVGLVWKKIIMVLCLLLFLPAVSLRMLVTWCLKFAIAYVLLP